MTKTSKIIALAALSFAAVSGASAEEYQGVIAPVSAFSRAEVNAQAVQAARAEQNLEYVGQQVAVAPAAPRSRAAVQAEAVAAAHSPTWNLDSKAFVNSTIPAQYTQGSLSVYRKAGL
ncbi:MAG: alpha/beta hydrolase [Pseudacidovorax sp.]|nr:alpha/beta hydrolase [Pseudacidovorax sp.]